MTKLNETHDPALRSWVESANEAGCDFPVQNLPFGVFRRAGSGEMFRGGVAIGDQILDLDAVRKAGLLRERAADALASCSGNQLNAFMAMGREAASALRRALSKILRADAAAASRLASCLVSQAGAEMTLPASIGDYTDFYASIHHATNIGKMFRPDNPLLPNYAWIPIGYHGRSSSIRVSGHDFHRPVGQTRKPNAEQPTFGPCEKLDYEMEIGVFIGAGNKHGQRVGMRSANDHVFGLCLLNDWSARDIQAWEYQPLGPFLSKNFATTLSPWVVTLEALAPFRSNWSRAADHPQPLPYLQSEENDKHGALEIQLEVLIETEQMRRHGDAPMRLSLGNFRSAYWTVSQMVTHHTTSGCNLRPGDLLGSGTMSGDVPGTQGALVEITQGGQRPLTLDNGETRKFLMDGDKIIMRGWCEKTGAKRIGFGAVEACVLPANSEPHEEESDGSV